MKRWIHSAIEQPKQDYRVEYVDDSGASFFTIVKAIDYDDAKQVFNEKAQNFSNPVRRIKYIELINDN